MNSKQFLAEFEPGDFPSEARWISFADHDPPFTMAQLVSMEKRGLIEFRPDSGRQRYRLTMKASAKRAAIDPPREPG